MDGTEIVTFAQWDSYSRRIERANCKKHGHSLTATGIARRANHLIIDIRSGEKVMLVQKGWREAMKKEEKP